MTEAPLEDVRARLAELGARVLAEEVLTLAPDIPARALYVTR